MGCLLGLASLWGAVRAGRRKRLVNDVPTSKTTGVFIGLVELTGTAEIEQPLISYLAETECVQYEWSVEEHWRRTVTETYRDEKGNTRTRTRIESGWTTVADGGEMRPFYLQDDCGVVRVVPDGAKLEPWTLFSQECSTLDPVYYAKGPAGGISNSTGQRRFTETGIPLHAGIYVMGQACERADIVAPEIAYDQHAELFLISTQTEKEVSGEFALAYWGWGCLGLVLTVVGVVIGDTVGQSAHDPRVGLFVAAGVGYLALWLVSWTIMTFNSLIGLRQRVAQAWANVDVQLKRRADLIPNLVKVVEGLRDYERQTQTAVAAWRGQVGVTAPGQPGPNAAALTPQLVALVERYPELKANESFGQLQETLIETEQRIALARSYFNDIATFYNTRLQIVPDRFLAALAAMKPHPLMEANAFEREPVRVTLAA